MEYASQKQESQSQACAMSAVVKDGASVRVLNLKPSSHANIVQHRNSLTTYPTHTIQNYTDTVAKLIFTNWSYWVQCNYEGLFYICKEAF